MKRPCFIAGLVVLALSWTALSSSPFSESVTGHMLAHMGVVALAAPLIVIGLPGTSTISSHSATLVAPLPASLIELVVVWTWHVPALRQLANTSGVATAIEQASFLVAGLLLWRACLATRRAESRAAGTFALFVTSVHMTLLGALLALAPRPLYGDADVTCLGAMLTAEQDQHLAGVTMLLIGGAIYLAGGLVLLAGLLSAPADKAGVG